MKFYRFAGLLLIAILVVAPLSVFAQDSGEPELDTYTSEDQLLTLTYPKGWIANKSDFLYGAQIYSSQDIADMAQSPDAGAVPSGGVVVDVTLASLDTMKSFGIEVEEGMAPADVLTAFLGFISQESPEGQTSEGEGEAMTEGESEGQSGDQAEGEGSGQSAAGESQGEGQTEGGTEAQATVQPPQGESQGEGEAQTEGSDQSDQGEGEGAGAGMAMQPPVVGEIQTTTFEDGREAAWAQVQFPDQSDDVYIVFEVADGAYAIVDYFTAPGELTEEQIQTATQIAQSIQFAGTTEDLATPGPQIEQSNVDPSTLNGEELVNERCTTCHTRERIDNEDEDEEGWTAIVDRMISYGAQLDSAERQAVIDYLVATH